MLESIMDASCVHVVVATPNLELEEGLTLASPQRVEMGKVVRPPWWKRHLSDIFFTVLLTLVGFVVIMLVTTTDTPQTDAPTHSTTAFPTIPPSALYSPSANPSNIIVPTDQPTRSEVDLFGKSYNIERTVSLRIPEDNVFNGGVIFYYNGTIPRDIGLLTRLRYLQIHFKP